MKLSNICTMGVVFHQSIYLQHYAIINILSPYWISFHSYCYYTISLTEYAWKNLASFLPSYTCISGNMKVERLDGGKEDHNISAAQVSFFYASFPCLSFLPNLMFSFNFLFSSSFIVEFVGLLILATSEEG